MERSGSHHLNPRSDLVSLIARHSNSSHLVMLYEVPSITSQVVSPKMFNLNLIKLFDLTSSLQDIQLTEKQVKNHPEETIR